VGSCCNGAGFGVAGPDDFVSESIASAFIPSATYELTDVQVEVQAGAEFGKDPNFDVSLYSSVAAVGGDVPGSLIIPIESDLTAPGGVGLVTASGGAASLMAGTEYWIVLSPFDSATLVFWDVSTIAGLGTAGMVNMGPWGSGGDTLQFEVDGLLVAEPSGSTLMLIGLATVCVFIKFAALAKSS
jgi:hypothetical protein